MRVEVSQIPDLKEFEVQRFSDSRGFFSERYNHQKLASQGLEKNFVQDNFSRSQPKVLRGLHYQFDQPQGKLVGCLRGCVWDVAVDIRPNSRTYGHYVAMELSEENGRLLWMPAGFAHGFCVLGTEPADVLYKVDHYYNPKGEAALHWHDPDLAIDWPIQDPILSAKDESARSFAEYRSSSLAQSTWWSV